ncbi:DUF2207 domain-containing protein [[Clostridium] aminophilum]|uniref:Uncharacterized membrane protein n=1 Tax=[Clostridium] aminophilum TaxID=1526 RepID=A0A1I6ISW2_9FIRM|nr:DUF2207 domain-containing protein [[Clostridium] aminophilum]SFR69818.1 Uncharacterized membrane protein [[Clostridium] aminophilum]
MKRIKSFAAALCLALCFCIFPAGPVYADNETVYHDSDPKDYITRHFNVWAEFDSSHTAAITEEISVDFIKAHHGITRNIPEARDGTYEIRNVSVNDYNYSVEKESGNVVVRIGDAEKYLEGDQTFVISYQIEYLKDTDTSADFLAQNMLPTEWQTSIRQVQLSLTMPSEIDWDNMFIYYGEYGAVDDERWKSCFDYEINGDTLTLYGEDLGKGCGLTLRDTRLPDGYWSDARTYAEVHKTAITVIMIVSILTAVLSILLWIRYGRDDAIIETVEFYPPDQMTPAEIGYAMDEELSDGEMMTMVFYLADKGYITIEPEKGHFVLKREKDAADEEPQHVKDFLLALFKGRKCFRTDKVPMAFREPFNKAKTRAEKDFREKHDDVYTVSAFLSRCACLIFLILDMAVYYWSMDGHFDGVYLAVFPVGFCIAAMYLACTGMDNFRFHKGMGVVKIVAGFILYALQILISLWWFNHLPQGEYTIAFAVSMAVIFLAMTLMQKRTPENTRLMGRINGFRSFIKNAEYERIVALSEEDPEYFYHILPYAAILGLETQWTRHFEKISIPQPEWYRSDDTFVYSPVWCNQIVRSCTTKAVPPVPSGGSSGGYSGGSSGGGFSGGGGGGGGGGAW